VEADPVGCVGGVSDDFEEAVLWTVEWMVAGSMRVIGALGSLYVALPWMRKSVMLGRKLGIHYVELESVYSLGNELRFD
jgi:hypothetical protein